MKIWTLFEFVNNFLEREQALKIHNIFRKCVSFNIILTCENFTKTRIFSHFLKFLKFHFLFKHLEPFWKTIKSFWKMGNFFQVLNIFQNSNKILEFWTFSKICFLVLNIFWEFLVYVVNSKRKINLEGKKEIVKGE